MFQVDHILNKKADNQISTISGLFLRKASKGRNFVLTTDIKFISYSFRKATIRRWRRYIFIPESKQLPDATKPLPPCYYNIRDHLKN